MIEDAERTGSLAPGDTIVEGTGGNTGIALAQLGASKDIGSKSYGYSFIIQTKYCRVVLTMPDNISKEKVALMEHFGAKVSRFFT